jgi:hypothetical protein
MKRRFFVGQGSRQTGFKKICLEVGTLPAKRTLRTGQPGKIILLSASSLQSQKPHI